MKWYVLRYIFEGKKFSCRIEAHSFDKAYDFARQFADAAQILSLTECPVQATE